MCFCRCTWNSGNGPLETSAISSFAGYAERRNWAGQYFRKQRSYGVTQPRNPLVPSHTRRFGTNLVQVSEACPSSDVAAFASTSSTIAAYSVIESLIRPHSDLLAQASCFGETTVRTLRACSIHPLQIPHEDLFEVFKVKGLLNVFEGALLER